MTEEKIHRIVFRVLELLANQDYASIAELTAGKRLSVGEISDAVNEYGRTIVPAPDEAARDLIDIVEVDASGLRAWSVYAPVWTKEEGRSDLTVSLTIIEQPGAEPVVELDDIHVH